MNEILVTFKNKDQLLKDIDFSTVDVLKFKGISGKELGIFLFDAATKCIYNNDKLPIRRHYGKEFHCIKHEGIILGFRTTLTTVYSYLKVREQEPNLRSMPRHSGFKPIYREFNIKDFIAQYRNLITTQQETRKTKQLENLQNEIERTTLAEYLHVN